LRGKSAGNPLRATAGNFLRAVPFAIALGLAAFPWSHLDRTGLAYAIISGALTSGIGYAIWYAVLPALSATSAATVQLSVPVLAAAGGILALGETLTLRFVVATVGVLGGIAIILRTGQQARLTAQRE
jgi:drug/metabolite transporter (DMT)-like permease